ncbi:MAG: AAA family ATPase [Bacteroidales bacterium]|nr:AAA family ATPase [Bacteroidales bacterium]
MLIIGITGTLGAGKGTIVDFLVKQKEFVHFSVRDYLIREILKRGLTVDRNSMTDVANDLRAKNSSSYIVDELHREALKTGKNSVIESLRTPGEIDSLKAKGNFFLFAVDAPPQVRFDRIKKRASETDHIDFATFIQNEKREMTTNDPNKQNLKHCIQMADFVFENTGSVAELEMKVEEVIRSINAE